MSPNTRDRLAENRLLALLPAAELDAMCRHAEVVSLRHGHHAIVPDEPIRDVYFPLSCLLSMVTTMEDGSTVESGTIGREGMSGIPVFLNAGRTTSTWLSRPSLRNFSRPWRGSRGAPSELFPGGREHDDKTARVRR